MATAPAAVAAAGLEAERDDDGDDEGDEDDDEERSIYDCMADTRQKPALEQLSRTHSLSVASSRVPNPTPTPAASA
ncbi:hypothetical protein DAEQUDRAFT_770433 [Daedalea quercina L-15889]|uniref:Uncharacterized protein n=1 Tax=Daedalea quercina L-15889 TaxID=1314783 RepID=A0A165KVA1_9APHY|nr:hypothetical protein DAEQUDRAFT_770433 [Daedalea quercina L-15889]